MGKPKAKPKTRKKKPQTITEKATAQYVPADMSTSPSLVELFAQSTLRTKSKLDKDGSEHEKPKKKAQLRAAATKDRKRRKGKTPNPKKHVPVLLSPGEAMKAVDNQCLFFGTSSQLAREESPPSLGVITETAKAAEATCMLDLHLDSAEKLCMSRSVSSNDSNLPLLMSSRNLWSEAARDAQGSLLSAEIIELVDSPPGSPTTGLAAVSVIDSKPTVIRDHLSNVHVLRNQDDIITGTRERNPAISPDLEARKASVELPKSVAEGTLRARKRSKSPVKGKIVSSVEKKDPNETPKFSDYTIPELSKMIISYGFKPVKGKVAMIKLLEKCWEGKNRLALQPLPQNVNVPVFPEPIDILEVKTSKASSPVKRRGRPPKRDNAPPTGIIPLEVPTSDVPVTKSTKSPQPPKTSDTAITEVSESAPTRSRRRTKTKHKQPGPDNIEDPNFLRNSPLPHLQPPITEAQPLCPPRSLINSQSEPLVAGDEMQSPRSSTDHLFAKITMAITTFPPSHNPKNLTWNEKILMYDPIVLEDLAAWLNTVGLGGVGVDEEVGPGTVRAWCEGRGICCLWRDNLRGGARNRY